MAGPTTKYHLNMPDMMTDMKALGAKVICPT
jgi:hypothetical protein